LCNGSWTDYNLKCKQENARSFVKLYAHPQPLRHCVPPPLAQGRPGEFTACYLPLHRGGWGSLLRATSPYRGGWGSLLRATSPCTGEAGGVYCVLPPLTQGRLEDFAPCHLPLHRGGWGSLLRATSPCTGEARRCCESARSDGRASRTALGLIFRYDFFEKSWRQAEKDGILRR